MVGAVIIIILTTIIIVITTTAIISSPPSSSLSEEHYPDFLWLNLSTVVALPVVPVEIICEHVLASL